MLKKLILNKFQRHSKLVINFSPTITTIVGQNDRGKSSIVRALRWVALNKPLRNNFIKHKNKRCSVSLFFDGHKVKRIKGTKNIYELDGVQLEAFKSDVPTDITNLLNIGPENFQRQHDASYWFSESAGEVSKRINEIVDLGIIDSVLYDLNSRVRKSKAVVEITQEQLNEAKEEEQKTKWVKSFSSELEVIKEADEKIQKVRDKQTSLQSALLELPQLQKTIKTEDSFQSRGWEILSLANSLSEKKRYSEALKNLLESINKYQSFILDDSIFNTQPLKKKLDECQQENLKINYLVNLLEDIQSQQLIFSKWSTKQKNIQEKLKGFSICPICKRSLK